MKKLLKIEFLCLRFSNFLAVLYIKIVNFDDVTRENIINQILIKFIYMLKIHMKENINC